MRDACAREFDSTQSRRLHARSDCSTALSRIPMHIATDCVPSRIPMLIATDSRLL